MIHYLKNKKQKIKNTNNKAHNMLNILCALFY